MYIKSVLFLLALGSIDASFYSLSDGCMTPRLTHGRVRMRQRSRLARFTCMPRYELVGNKYATCRNGEWDVPLPVCVRPTCRMPQFQNGLRMLSHGGAWIIFFCFPNHELVGSPVIYCDGYKWNGTAPKCIDTTVGPKLSCDFEDPDLCGWKQDALHDFDWLRLNSKTPSSILSTGPSYDHTLGKEGEGHYMYIESTSQLENDTARLISPVYENSLTQDGCFSFSYHMYGKTCGGLRVYQKPDNITLKAILDLPEEERRTYLLFDKWGNLGDIWFNAVNPLKNFSLDFQIIIEGIRGTSYTSDIAIDDVAILQGENCTAAAQSATTPSAPTTTIAPDSCVNRCLDGYVSKPKNDTRCDCSYNCLIEENCCPDFIIVCVYGGDSTTTDNNVSVTPKSVSEEAPQTLKLVAFTTESTTTTSSSTSTSTTRTSTTTRHRTTKARPKPTQPILTTTKLTPRPSTTPTPFTTTSTKTTTPKLTTTNKPSPTYKSTTYKRITTSTKSVPVSIGVVPLTTTMSSIMIIPTTTRYKVSKPIDNDNYLASVEKEKEKEKIENKKSISEDVNKKIGHIQVNAIPKTGEMSTSVKVIVVILVLASLIASAMVIHAGSNSARVRIALARFRGHWDRDPEVRYLSNDIDDD